MCYCYDVLDQAKLNDMWWAGFCSKAIEHARGTEPGMRGSPARVQFMKVHLRNDECVDCHNANVMKHLESIVARVLGPQESALFEAGGDIGRHLHTVSVKRDRGGKVSDVEAGRNKYMDALKQVLDVALSEGMIDQEYMKWMEGIRPRYGKPYQAAS